MAKRWICLMILALQVLAGASFAQSPKQPNLQPPSVVASAPPISPKDAEILALQKQNEIIKQYHSSLLDTVYWALGIVGLIAALIVGASGLI